MNGFTALQFFGIGKASRGKFSPKHLNLIVFTFGTELVAFLSSLCALPTVWQISHKILLITGSLVMLQAWLLVFFISDIECNDEIFTVISFIFIVYQFLQTWCYRCTQFVISFEMETLYSNCFLVCLDYFFSLSRVQLLAVDPLFGTRYEALPYLFINFAVTLYFKLGVSGVLFGIQRDEKQKKRGASGEQPVDSPEDHFY